jgi:N-acetyl sugar amidotransferase
VTGFVFSPAPILGALPDVRLCTRCVMDTTDPDITFDAAGVCSHCHAYDRLVTATVRSGPDGERQLAAAVEKIRRDGAGKAYDCAIGISGGVDSTFVAYQVKQLGLRPVAVHLDNGWDSEIAATNISSALRALGVDLETLVIDWAEFKDIQLAFLRAGVPDCEIPSDHAIVASVHQVAVQHRLRHTIWGYNTRTETHLPKAWSQGHLDWRYIRTIHRRFGSGRIRTFPHLNFMGSLGFFPTANLNLLDYVDYVKADAIALLQRELGWRSYGGKHHENIYTRWYQGWFLPTRFGYDKRKTHLSSLICSGQITRDAAREELLQPTYSVELQRADTEYVIKKFGLSEEEFQAIMDAPRRTFREFPSYAKVREGRPYQMARGVYRRLRGRGGATANARIQ